MLTWVAVVGLLFSELAFSFRLLPTTRFSDHHHGDPQGATHAHVHAEGHSDRHHRHDPAPPAEAGNARDAAHTTEDDCGCGPDCGHCLSYYASVFVPLLPPEPGADTLKTHGLMPRHRAFFMSDRSVSPALRPPIA